MVLGILTTYELKNINDPRGTESELAHEGNPYIKWRGRDSTLSILSGQIQAQERGKRVRKTFHKFKEGALADLSQTEEERDRPLIYYRVNPDDKETRRGEAIRGIWTYIV